MAGPWPPDDLPSLLAEPHPEVFPRRFHLGQDRKDPVEVPPHPENLYERGASREEARPYPECVFEIADPAAQASPGAAFRE